MKPYFEDNLVRIYNKDSRDMSELPDESVQMVCTSPPYWGLRKYADLPDLVWGDTNCEHEWQPNIKYWDNRAASLMASEGMADFGGKKDARKTERMSDTCSLCGAWKGQLGLEPTPELYLQHLIEIMREIRRVLRKDGVFFLNIGDSYAQARGHGHWETREGKGDEQAQKITQRWAKVGAEDLGLKPKDLCLIPFQMAIAARADGWWVRSVIIWSKSNPMPESVTDRPTESHEYILMLTKSGTTQYWTHRDGGGTRERPKADYRWINQLTNEEVAIEPADWKGKIPCSGCNGTGKETAVLWGDYEVEIGKCPKCGGKGKVQLWKRINLWRGHDYYWDADAVREPHAPASLAINGYNLAKTPRSLEKPFNRMEKIKLNPAGRNIRSVWEFPTQPYPEAHFAVFPEKLPELCIKAATPEAGCCSKCGAPWERVIQKESMPRLNRQVGALERNDPDRPSGMELAQWRKEHPVETLGWQPTCSCNADKVPSIVLDPFLGAGTTLWVAKKLGRRGVGYELSEAYCALSLERLRQMVMGLTS